jgi:hypothetical protein
MSKQDFECTTITVGNGATVIVQAQNIHQRLENNLTLGIKYKVGVKGDGIARLLCACAARPRLSDKFL